MAAPTSWRQLAQGSSTLYARLENLVRVPVSPYMSRARVRVFLTPGTSTNPVAIRCYSSNVIPGAPQDVGKRSGYQYVEASVTIPTAGTWVDLGLLTIVRENVYDVPRIYMSVFYLALDDDAVVQCWTIDPIATELTSGSLPAGDELPRI